MVKFWHKKFSNIGNCSIGDGTIVHSHVWIADGVKIGLGCKIQAFTFIPEGVEIGNGCFIGPRVTFTNDKHPIVVQKPDYIKKTVVEDGANIGACAVILPGLRIGKGATIGAGSVVTRSVPRGETWAGNPARKLK